MLNPNDFTDEQLRTMLYQMYAECVRVAPRQSLIAAFEAMQPCITVVSKTEYERMKQESEHG